MESPRGASKLWLGEKGVFDCESEAELGGVRTMCGARADLLASFLLHVLCLQTVAGPLRSRTDILVDRERCCQERPTFQTATAG